MNGANGADALSDPTVMIPTLIALTSWVADPAVMTAMASLLTALAAFWRSRSRRVAEPGTMQPHAQPPSLADAYSTLHEAEEKIREELLQQLQHLQEEVERIGQDLSQYRQVAVKLEEAIIRCPDGTCPVRSQLEAP